MRTLDRQVHAPLATGRRIVLPWRSVADKVKLNTGELVVMGGAPGGGKSTLAANLAVASETPVLYFAQDTPTSMLARMVALLLGVEVLEARRHIASDPDYVSRRLADSRPQLIFNAGAVTVERIEASVDALTEWIGAAPHMVIIDNLIDLRVDGFHHQETGFYAEVLPRLKQMAIHKDCSVLALHHVIRSGPSRDQASGTSPLRLTDLLHAGEREARHVWGVFHNGDDEMYWQILKQQDGPANPGGELKVPLRWRPRMGRLEEIR